MNIFRKIFYFLYSKHLIKKHAYEREEFEDRDVLERIIIPYVLCKFNPKKVLDIGREDYQEFYNKFFFAQELWTIDINPEREEFGAKNHIIDNAANIKKHFKDNYFGFVLFNGVFGWGLDKREEIERTLGGIYDILEPGGIFIFGWNDIPSSTPVPLGEIEALKKFKPYYFKPLKGESFKAKNGEHTYNFYVK